MSRIIKYLDLDQRAVAFAVAGAGLSLINGIFNFYYVKFFLNIYHIEEKWFQAAQMLFLVWNAVNDPLFGYLQDTSKHAWCRVRRLSIFYSAILFSVSFLLPWYPFMSIFGSSPWIVGLHLILSLCLYDTMFTFIGLALCALFTEMSTDFQLRLKLVRYSRFTHVLSSSGVFFCEQISSNLVNLTYFRLCCIVASIVSCLCLRYGGKYGTCAVEEHGRSVSDTSSTSSVTNNKSLMAQLESSSTDPNTSWLQLTCQILKQQNFLRFVAMNFLQIFHISASIGFFRIYAERLVFSRMDPSLFQTLFYGCYPILPEFVIILSSKILASYGTYRILTASFMAKISLGLTLYLMGSGNLPILVIYYLLDNILASGVFHLFNMVVSDIVDADAIKHKRSFPISSMIYGTNALITKPAQSLAPMFVVTILNAHGYDTISTATTSSPLSGVGDDLNHYMFLLSALIPVAVGALQLVVFLPFTLRDSHKQTTPPSLP